jgi:hypothetical protein
MSWKILNLLMLVSMSLIKVNQKSSSLRSSKEIQVTLISTIKVSKILTFTISITMERKFTNKYSYSNNKTSD